MEITDSRSFKVVKANDLIQKTRFSLSTQEQKIILYMISKIQPNSNTDEVIFDLVDFCKICGIETQGKNRKDIKDALKGLSDKSIWITLEDGTETLLRWIERPYIAKGSKSIRIKIDEMMKPYLFQLQSRFTQYELLYTLAMRSQYSIRIYELLKSYEYLGVKIFEITELKRILQAENYTRFPDFRRKVLEISMREINQYSDMSVKYEIEKEGRKFAKIRFFIQKKKDITERIETWDRIDKVINSGQISLLDKIKEIESKN